MHCYCYNGCNQSATTVDYRTTEIRRHSVANRHYFLTIDDVMDKAFA